ncbi:MAG TPA: GTPase, partial [Gemmataceae bacterium]|nr:GTPase [Gemmataceae bacterium]
AAGRWATAPDGGFLSRVVRQLGARLLPWLQEHLLTRFWAAYVEYCGQHLIELYSGRLQPAPVPPAPPPLPDGETAPAVAAPPPPPDAAAGVRQVTVTLMGQVKAGKSSLVNALLGEQRARADVLPATAGVDRYELQPAGIPTRLVLLDTVGYGHAGPKEDQLPVTQEAARQSDLLLLVMHARNPARQADRDLLQALRQWFASQPELRMPPILGVLTHIDLLSPAMEWAPPYDWQQPRRPKEAQIAAAVEAAREQVGDHLAAVVPACTSPGRGYGIEEWLLPAVARLMDDAHAVAFLRCLRAEIDTDRARKVFRQLAEAGRLAVRWFREEAPADRLSEPQP